MNALPIAVYKNPSYKGCSNGGLTEKYDELLLICDDGCIEIDMDNPPENLVKIVIRNLFGKEYKHIEPYAKPKHLGWMAGGAIGYTSDSRFPSEYPLQIHDRQETSEEYEMYSR